jgi:thiol-disulfide isomerase/thioredoxin
MLCAFAKAFAQEPEIPLPVKIGDTLSSAQFQNVINYKSSIIDLNDFRNKILVLDFWATWCENCIDSFADSYKLEKKYPDDLQIVLVNSRTTRDTRERIEAFFKLRKSYYTFPCIVYDTVLTKLFPHQTIPHYVWLRNGRVFAITGEGQLTENNLIAAKLNIHSGIEQAKFIPYNAGNEIIQDDSVHDSFNLNYHTILAAYRKDLQSLMYTDRDADGYIRRVVLTNYYKMALLRFAFPELPVNSDRLIFKVRHSDDFVNDSTGEAWRERNVFTYESTFPKQSFDEVRQAMQSDLEKYFNVRVYSEDTVIRCFTLKVGDSSRITKTKDALVRPGSNLFEKTGAPVYFINYSVKEILQDLERVYKIPFVDQTDLDSRIDLKLGANVLNTSELIQQLKAQGLILKLENTKVRFFTIAETGTLQ